MSIWKKNQKKSAIDWIENDSIPAMLSPGEYVMKSSMFAVMKKNDAIAQEIQHSLVKINTINYKKQMLKMMDMMAVESKGFAKGGLVNPPSDHSYQIQAEMKMAPVIKSPDFFALLYDEITAKPSAKNPGYGKDTEAEIWDE